MKNVRFVLFSLLVLFVLFAFAGSAWAADPVMPDAVIVNGVVYYKTAPTSGPTLTFNGVTYTAASPSSCATAYSASACASSDSVTACASAGSGKHQGSIRRLLARFRSRREAGGCG